MRIKSMISFKEFLASQEDRLRAEQTARTQAIRCWITAVVTLIEQIEKWIKESDPHQLVQMNHRFLENSIDDGGTTSKEAGQVDHFALNIYVDARLDISLGGESIRIRPVALEVLGPRWKPGDGQWVGRVDMAGEPYGYELFRFVYDDGCEEWYLRSTRDYQIRLLDQASFDAALVDLFA